MEYETESLGIIKRLHEAGFQAVYVGGCVRDSLLGAHPKDWDIATSARPDEVELLFPRTIPVGRAFGVMIIIGENGKNYEVATFRRDGGYQDGRRPESVEFCPAEEDAKRRDFTINALMFDPLAGRLIDYVGGEKDLRARRLRTVGVPQERFFEDYLRLLRAVRFAARTGFELDPGTFAAVREMAGLVRLVSAERVGEELLKMFSCPGAARALTLLFDTWLLPHVLPEVAAMRGMPQPKEFHPEGDVFEHTRLMLEMHGRDLPEEDFLREVGTWAVLLHDVGKPLTLSVDGRIRFNRHDETGAALAEEILRRLKRPTKIIEAVRDIIGRHMHFATLGKMRLSKLRRFLREPVFPLHLRLHLYDCSSSHRQLANYEFGLNAWKEEMAKPEELEPLLTGNDLIAMGYAPGPLFGRILEALEDARLEGEVADVVAARIWVRNHYRDHGANTKTD